MSEIFLIEVAYQFSHANIINNSLNYEENRSDR